MIDLEEIRVLMARKRINQQALATRSGLSHGTIAKFLAGTEPKYTTICSLISGLGLSDQQIVSLFFKPEATAPVASNAQPTSS